MKDMPEFDEFEDVEERFTGFHIGEIALSEMDKTNVSCRGVRITDSMIRREPESELELEEQRDNLFVLTPQDVEFLNSIRRKFACVYRRKVPNRYFRKATDKVFVEVGKAHLIWVGGGD